jgi:hypothetical protein
MHTTSSADFITRKGYHFSLGGAGNLLALRGGEEVALAEQLMVLSRR